MKKLYWVLLLLSSAQLGLNQSGSLDNSFGNTGFVRTNILGFKSAENSSKIFPLPDGSFYLVVNANNVAHVVHRFQNGAFDYRYGINGYSSAILMNAFTAAIQPDGKILVGGVSSDDYPNRNFGLARVNPNGKLDSSFAGDGILNTDFFSGEDRLHGLAVQPDGKIVAAGYCMTSGPYSSFAIARYNIDGTLDNSFSGDGKQTTDFGGPSSRISSVVIQADGKILTAGFADVNSTTVIALARFQTNGMLDNTFGIGGKVTVHDGIGGMACAAMTLQTDGKIVLTGYGTAPNHFHEDMVLARLNTNGSRDSSFAGTGVRFADPGPDANHATSVVVQNDGRIIIGGTTRINNAPPLYALMRFLPDGNIDYSYSGDGDGIQLTRIGDLADYLSTMALHPNGDLIAAGSSIVNNKRYYSVARYKINGDLDLIFDGDGFLTDGILLGTTYFYSSVVQPDGKIIAVGSARMESNNDFAVVRHNTDGSLDNNFSDDGTLTIDFGTGDDQALGVALLPDGKLIVGGFAFNGSNFDFALVRLNADGSIDHSFSGDGKLLFDFNNRNDRANAVAIQTDGKIVLAGFSADGTEIYSSPNTDFALVRFNPDGTIDNSFGMNGNALTDLGYADFANAMALQADGKIVLAGARRSDFYSALGTDFALARYNPDGNLDLTFGGTGKIMTDFFYGGDFGEGIALQADGKIVVVGSSSTYPSYNMDIVSARYLPNGSLDNAFSGDGLLTLNLGSGTEGGRSVVIQSNGKIILGIGYDIEDYDFALVRLNADGTLDNSFAGDGSVIVDFGHGMDNLENLSLHNSRVYAVGSSDYGTPHGAIAAFIIDNTIIPSITCPASKVTSTDPWICSAVINNIDPLVVPPGSQVTYSLTGATTLSGSGSASGIGFATGITDVTYRLMNDPTMSCHFTITVKDNELPRAEYPFMQNICYNGASNYTLPPLQIMDNCGLSRVDFKISGATFRNGTGTDASGQFNIGDNSIDWTVTDNSGNSIKLYSLVKIDGPLSVTIPDVSTIISPITEVNTVYLGYKPAEYITLNSVANVSTGIYYATEWSDGFKASWNTVHPTVTTTYSVTITDLAGCKATASKTIRVVDVRCGDQKNKVLVCKPGETPVCTDFWNVISYFNNGYRLGSCQEEILTKTAASNNSFAKNNNLEVYPNPSQQEFKLQLHTKENVTGELIIRDQLGKIVERIRVKSNQYIVVGKNYRPGIYFAEFILQNKRHTAKLIKQ